ncbi:MAG: hypothetical protein IJY91_06685 [Oscillospiraceae bacterium]|nr:hypothetical protein [Oscillospiraceae bacterium]
MAKFFDNNSATQQLSQRQTLQAKYNGARTNLLLVIIFTLINIVLLVINSGTYFLFSSFIPWMMVDDGMYSCGLYPAEVYESGMAFLDTSYMVFCGIVAGMILVLYLLSWILSKKPRVGWMIFALVVFVIDTAALLLMVVNIADWIIDIAFHGWVIFSLINGIISYFKLKKLPEEEPETLPFPEMAAETAAEENL